MDAYIDIRLLPDPEFPPNLLMNALFGKLHRGLVGFGEEGIGVSFPEVREKSRSLGRHLRLHGPSATLERFMQTGWLKGMGDHLTASAPAAVPAQTHYRSVRRVQAKSNPERERRRLIARKGVSEEEARAAIPDACAEHLDLPCVVLNSHSTGQQFRLFIEHLPVQNQPRLGAFSAYGLSTSTTVPWF
ncbi:MAG: type I-F CRISPR-associated endoribonuclease Cas6/Csy4 [Betaproteobacteria bacterium]|nr:type I-F CRISPR-associated endoribonuclease Cas6/Csy4 [Betaproteobacteria bacterium]